MLPALRCMIMPVYYRAPLLKEAKLHSNVIDSLAQAPLLLLRQVLRPPLGAPATSAAPAAQQAARPSVTSVSTADSSVASCGWLDLGA
jgi:hypothetical protein